MEPISENKRQIIEAVIFGSDEPLTIRQIQDIFWQSDNNGPRFRVKEEEILTTIRELNAEYVQTGRPFRIIQVAGGFQYATMPEFAEWLGRMIKEKSRRKLTQATIETLSVIAYKQPVTKPEIEAIRGVNADYAIQKLMERGLVTIVGRAATPGRPLLYGTTQDFLKHFGINDLSELPKPREIDEIMAEQGMDMERELLRRMGKTDEEIEERLGTTVVSESGHLQEIPPPSDQQPDSDSKIQDETRPQE
jgi:segregation and condensation protein B